MRKLSFIVKAETTVVTKEEELQAIPAEAGEFVVKVVSNVDIKVAEPEVDWVTVAVTKADYKLTLTLQENTTGAPRETTIKVLRADNGTQVQAIKIAQIATPKVYGPVDSNIKWTALRDEKAYDKANETSPDENVLNVTYGETQYEKVDYLKLGTKSAAGKATLKLPKGTVYVSFFGFGWKGADGVLKVNGLEKTFTLPQNDGISNNTWNVTVTDADLHEITLPEPLAEDTDVVINTVSPNYRVVLFGIKASDTAPVKKELTVERVWGKYSTSGSYWNASFGGTASSDRNIAMDDEYIYLPETTASAKMWKIPLDGTTDPSLVNVEGVSGGTHALSCVRIVSNTSSKVNGGKDFLMACNLTTNSESEALTVYSWNNGTSNAPVSESVSNGRGLRIGDKFSVYGSLQDGALFFRNWNASDGWGGKGTILVLRMAWDNVPIGGYFNPRITFSYDVGGISAYYPFPGDASNGVIANVSAAGQYASYANSPLNTNPNESGTFTASSGYYDNTAGYNFLEYNGKRYVAYVKNADGGDGRFYILQGETTDSWEDILGSKRKVIYQADIQQDLAYADGDYHEDLAAGVTKTSANSALDCAARVIGGDLYFAALKQGVGLSLFKMYMK